MKIFAISGWKGSGKDTAAAVLIKEFGFKRLGFADPLKDNVAAHFNLDRASMDDPKQKELPLINMPVYVRDGFSKNVNYFMFGEFKTASGDAPKKFFEKEQKLHTRIRHADKEYELPLYWTRRALCILEGSTKRSADPDYWVSRLVQSAREKGLDRVVVSDLRYKNELSAIKLALKPDDDLVTIRVERFDSSPSSDPSERDLDEATFDFVVSNKTTVEDFEKRITQIATGAMNESVISENQATS